MLETSFEFIFVPIALQAGAAARPSLFSKRGTVYRRAMLENLVN
jgi:hypothetical protein